MSSASAPPAVELRNISKDFGSNQALDNVDLRIGHGEVVGLVGQNGSGKSTLVKVLSGVYEPEPSGRLFVSGDEVALPLAPGQASEIGLSFVYQNLALAPGLTVLENLTLGQRVAGGTPFIKLQATQPGENVIQSDIGGYPPWTGYLLFLQTARALEHLAPISYDKAIGPDRIATPDNAVNVLTTGGWGTSWVNGFRGLLGLPPLSGSALTAASTPNGAMTAAP